MKVDIKQLIRGKAPGRDGTKDRSNKSLEKNAGKIALNKLSKHSAVYKKNGKQIKDKTAEIILMHKWVDVTHLN